MANYTVKLNTKGLDKLLREVEPRARDIIDKTAFDVEARAKEFATDMKAVSTGAMRASIYTESTRGARANNTPTSAAAMPGQIASMSNGDASFDFTPLPEPRVKLTAHVGPSVHYAPYVHWGTVKMGARPYLLNAVESIRPAFVAAWKALCKP
jgi:hypothetical protein